jgi:hypothetical protein
MTNLMIKDLEMNQDLDRAAMQSLRGGQMDLSVINAQSLAAEAKAGIAAISTATQTLVGINTLLNFDISPETNVNVGGIG